MDRPLILIFQFYFFIFVSFFLDPSLSQRVADSGRQNFEIFVRAIRLPRTGCSAGLNDDLLVVAKLINKVDAIIVEEIGSKNLARISHLSLLLSSSLFPFDEIYCLQDGGWERLERSLLALTSGDFRSLRLVKWPSRSDFQAENARV